MKKKISLILISILLLMLSACDKTVEPEIVPQAGYEGMIYVYYPTENEVLRDKEQYQIKQTDSVSASVEEVMTALMTKLSDTMTYYTYMMDVSNNVTLEFALLSETSKEYLLMADAAIANTLFQVDGIKAVSIKMSDCNGNLIEDRQYKRDSFCFYGYEDSTLNKQRVKIYYGNEEGVGLTSSYVLLHTSENESIQKNIVRLLAEKECIPSNTKVNSAVVNGGICYLDLSHEFVDAAVSVNGGIPLYSVVNSITNLADIDKVQILIDGQIVSTYRDSYDISEPLTFNKELIQ